MVRVSAAPGTESTLPTTRKSYANLPQILDVPNLIVVQLESFQRFQENGLKQLLEEISPIQSLTSNKLELTFVAYEFREPRPGHSEADCRERNLTYAAPLYVRVRLFTKDTGEIKEQDLFLGDIPLMTAKGTFITSGAERVVVSQLLRSPGVYFRTVEDATTGRDFCFAKLIPTRGAWLEFETSNRDVISTMGCSRHRRQGALSVGRVEQGCSRAPPPVLRDVSPCAGEVRPREEHCIP